MKKDFNRDELIELYVNQDQSLRQIAEQYGVSKEVIKRNLIESGIEIINKVHNNKGSSGKESGMWRDDIDVDKIIQMYQGENKNYTAIAKELGLSTKSVKRRLEVAGIEITRKPRSDTMGIKTLMNKVFYKYQYSARKRGYEFNLNERDFHELVQKPCRFCGNVGTSCEKGKNGFEYCFTGLDRWDSTKGYVQGNVISCCKVCNQMKSNMDVNVFANQIKKIYNYVE